jgi:phosphocarrier protein FPr/phosphocarrier protein
MDRGHPELAARLDALHPAVLQLIGAAAAAARAVNRVVAVCGGVAADMSALPVLLGLGVTELSVVPAAIPAVKRLIRTLDIGQCVAIATQCLALESAAEVRALVARSLTAAGETR